MADVTVLDLPLQTVFDETDYLHIINNLTSVDNRTTILSLSRWILEESNPDKFTVDLTNTRVGINVAAPATLIDAQATASNINHLILRHLSGTELFTVGDDSGQDGFIDIYNSLGVGKARIHSDGPTYFLGDGVGIGINPPATKLHVSDAGTIARIESTSAGTAAVALGMHGVELVAAAMDTTNKYGSAVKFMSTDPNFTTQNPKLLAGIFPRATESYAADTDGGMAIDFATTPDDPGATNAPLVRMTIYQNGNVAIGNSGVPSASRFYSLFDSATSYAGLFYNTNSNGYGLEVRGGNTNVHAAFRVADYLNNELMLVRGNGETTIIGQVGVNTAGVLPSMSPSGNDLIVGNGAGNNGMTVYSGAASTGSYYFADAASTPSWNDGFISFIHASQIMQLGTASTTRVSIDGNGNVNFSAYTAGTLVTDGSGNITASTVLPLESGTVALFGQATSPTGWTKITAWADEAMLVINSQADGTALAFGGTRTPRDIHTHDEGSLYSQFEMTVPNLDIHYRSISGVSYTANRAGSMQGGVITGTARSSGTAIVGSTGVAASPIYQDVIAATKD